MIIKTLSTNNKFETTVALALALAPILDPYVLFKLSSINLRLMDILMMLICGYLAVHKKRVGLINKDLLVLLTVFALVTLISFFSADDERSLLLGMKVLIIWSIYAFCVSNLWKENKYERFMKYATHIAILATILLIAQLIAVSLGNYSFFNGKLPFLQLSEYDKWSGLIDPNTGNIRVNSFFQEPSYFGIYCLPVFAQSIIDEKFKISIFLFLGLVITSSLVAIIGGICVIIFVFLSYKNEKSKNNFKFWGKVLAVSCISLIVLYVLYHNSSSIQSIVDYSIKRASAISTDLRGDRLGSTKIRILGYASYFLEYSTFLKIFGAGASQFPLLLSHYGVLAYSSTFVTVLLNYGLIGFGVFVYWLVKLLLKSRTEKKCFVLIFLIICLVDNFWFNWYFFYTLTWFLPFVRIKETHENQRIAESQCYQAC